MAMFAPDGRQIWVVSLPIFEIKPFQISCCVLIRLCRIKDMQNISDCQEMKSI